MPTLPRPEGLPVVATVEGAARGLIRGRGPCVSAGAMLDHARCAAPGRRLGRPGVALARELP
jgi:hypothetical protein